MNRSELQKLIDNCRGEADLHLPEVQPLAAKIASDPVVQNSWEKSQQIDAEIRQAIHDVPVPSDLEERLLAGLNFSATALAAPQSDSEAIVVAPTVATKRSKHWKAWSGAMAGIAAAILVCVLIWPAEEPSLATEEDAHQQTIAWIEQLNASSWQLTSPPSQFPIPVQLQKRPN